MTLDMRSPLAQALAQEGQRRGYGPMQIAASIGNAQVENGLRTGGTPGDNGTAYGGFQWRNERKATLDQTATKMGLPWDNPMVQAAHWYDEQDGSEARWGLKNAKSLEEANAAALSSLRPAGWTSGNPMGGMHAQDRLSASAEALRYLQTAGGGAPDGSRPPADSPGDSATTQAPTTGFVVPGNGEPPREGWDAFLSGGPGALFGHPQDDWSFGDALHGSAVALMSVDNPKGAEQLAGHYAAQRRAEQDRFTSQFDHRSGKVFRIDRRTGNVTASQFGEPQSNTSQHMTPTGELLTYDGQGNITNRQRAYDPPQKPMSDGLRKSFQANNDAADTHYNAASESQKFTRMLMDGKLDLSVMGRMGNDFANYTGHSDEGTRNAAAFMAHLERLRNAGLLAAKGVQTEGDAERMMNTLLPGNARFDNKAVGTLLRDIAKDNLDRYETAYRYNQPILKSYTDEDPAGYYQSRYDDRGRQFRANEDHFNAGWDKFLSEKPPERVVSGTPVDGRDPVRRPRGQPFKEFSLGRGGQARPAAPELELPGGP